MQLIHDFAFFALEARLTSLIPLFSVLCHPNKLPFETFRWYRCDPDRCMEASVHGT